MAEDLKPVQRITRNEIVKYQNQLNQVSFRRFNATDMNIFFSVVSRVRDKDSDQIVLSYDYLKKLSKYSKHDDFTKYLKRLTRKLQSITVESEDETIYRTVVLFTEFEANRKTQTLTCSVNPKFTFFFNELNKEFTRFSLNQYTTFNSSYSKTAFRLIKQYRTLGKRQFPLEEFRRLFDVPASYRVSDIDRRIIKMIKEEVSPVIPGLSITKQKTNGKRGKKVAGYQFTWKPEEPKANDFIFNATFEEKRAIENVTHNMSLNDEENWRAIDRIKHLELGTTEREQRLNELGIRKIEAEEKDIVTHGSDKERTNKRELAERIQVLQRKKEHSKLSEEEELELAQKIIQQRKMEIQ